MMRVADYIADFIYSLDVDTVFMLSGGGSIYLDDGVACHKHLKYISARNEATAPMMAEGYARLTGKLGVVYVTTGPGGANAVSGLVEAWVDSAPILIISGQVQRDQTSYNSGIKNLRNFGIQELNIVQVVKSITKYAIMVNNPEKIRYHLEKAVYLAKSGRPGPVWLDIPIDVQSTIIDEKTLKGFSVKLLHYDKETNNNKIDKVIALLKKSQRPLIIGGQGIRIGKAIEEFKSLLDLLNVPVVFSRLGQDILPYSYKNNMGHGGIKGNKITGHIMYESDLIISLGSRLAIPFIGSQLNAFSKNAKVVMVDIDDAELAKPGLKIELPIKADVKEFISEFNKIIRSAQLPDYSKWISKCIEYKEKYPMITKESSRNPIDLYYFVSRLDALAKKNDIFVSDAGSSYYVTGQVLHFEKGQREITSGAFASMGVAISLAIGCSVADNNAQILAVTGDGSLELNIQELKTMSYYGLNIKLFVINNGGYLSIRNAQQALCEGRFINSDQASSNEMLDFKKVADAFDLPYYNILTYEEIDEKIEKITNMKGPAFVEVMCDNHQKMFESKK